MIISGNNRFPLFLAVILFAGCAGLFVLMCYGGVRTADGEIVFRAGEALAGTGSLALDGDLDTWPGFAVARGTDGRLYSVFAPGQSLLLAPVIKIGLAVNQTRWYETTPFPLPISFTVDADSLKNFLLKRQPSNPAAHALRFLSALTVPFLSALAVAVFFLVLVRITASPPAALAGAVLLALATPFWSYSGTMFKEPLTMLWTLLSFYCLVANDPRYGDGQQRSGRLLAAGMFIGLAFFTHVRAVLFVPFFLIYGLLPYAGGLSGIRSLRKSLTAMLTLAAGFSVFAGAFCWLNAVRFGSIFETGRLISPVTYGTLVWPWEGLVGFLVSPGKGLFWFCPIVLVGLACWPDFHRRHRGLSVVLAAAVLFQWVFLSCRSDWHGGFCLGPRHLLPLVPFLLIPLATTLSRWFRADEPITGWPRRLLFLFFFGCIVQQVYFCLGEPVSFYYLIKQHFLERGISIIRDNSVYFHWGTSPLFGLLEARRGPFLLQQVPLGNYGLFVLISLVMGGLLTVSVLMVGRACRQG